MWYLVFQLCDTFPRIASLFGYLIASDVLDDQMFASANIGRGDPVEKYDASVLFFHLQRGNGYINQGRRKTNDRVRRAEREDSIRRTVYVSELDHTVSS